MLFTYILLGDAAIKKGERFLRRNKSEKANEQFERALEAYQKAYEVYPKPQIYYLIGLAEAKLGRSLDAHNHFKRLLEEVCSDSNCPIAMFPAFNFRASSFVWANSRYIVMRYEGDWARLCLCML